MVGVAVRAVADDLCEDLRAAVKRMLTLLEHQNAGTLAHDEATTLLIERDACALRIRRSAEGTHAGEAADAELRDARLGAAGHHDVLITITDAVESVADRVRTAGARGHRTGAHALEAVTDRDVRCRHVGNRHRNEERRHTLEATLKGLRMLLLDGAEAADTGRDDNAHTARLIFLRADAGVRSVGSLQLRCAPDAALTDRLLGGHDGELRIARHMLLLTTVDDGRRIEILHLTGELDREIFCIEMGDRADAALSGADGCPGSLCIIAGRIYRTETGDDDSTFIHCVLLYFYINFISSPCRHPHRVPDR